MIYHRRPISLLATLLVIGCDLPLTPAGGSPARVEIVLPSEPLTTGESTPLDVRVFDEEGSLIADIPPWTARSWTFDPGRLRVAGERIEALSSGSAFIGLDLAGLAAQGRLRINPAYMRVGVEREYVTQVIHPLEGALPLVAGRDGHLRVFLTGDQENFFRPTVRAHFYRGGQRVATLETRATDEGIPLQVVEGELRRSWNVRVPGSLIVPGAAYLIEITPDGGLRPSSQSVLLYPASGIPKPMDARVVAPLRITFVPMRTGGSVTGDVSPANVGEFMREAKQLWPLLETDVLVREPFTSTRGTATSADWEGLVRDIQFLRITDGSPRYYHGIVRRQGGTIAGIGFVGYPAAVSMDQLPIAGEIAAHELGHNFGRFHAPCGLSGLAADPQFPYPGGTIGGYGLTPDGNTVVPTTTADVMSYCRPAWVSDYNYRGVFAFRQAEAARSSSALAARQEDAAPTLTLIVSGTVAPGRATLDPAFSLETRPVLPDDRGPYTLQGLDDAGGVLFTIRFAGEEVADGASDERPFAFALPMAESVLARLVRLRMTGTSLLTERRSTIGPAERAQLLVEPREAEVSAKAASPGSVELRWDSARFPLVVARSVETGRIIGRISGGSANLRTDAPELELLLSHGVTSVTRRVRVEPR